MPIGRALITLAVVHLLITSTLPSLRRRTAAVLTLAVIATSGLGACSSSTTDLTATRTKGPSAVADPASPLQVWKQGGLTTTERFQAFEREVERCMDSAGFDYQKNEYEPSAPLDVEGYAAYLVRQGPEGLILPRPRTSGTLDEDATTARKRLAQQENCQQRAYAALKPTIPIVDSRLSDAQYEIIAQAVKDPRTVAARERFVACMGAAGFTVESEFLDPEDATYAKRATADVACRRDVWKTAQLVEPEYVAKLQALPVGG